MKKKTIFLNYMTAISIILVLNFVLPRLLPGDPLQAIYGRDALVSMSSELKQELVTRFSLDKPLGYQFLAYLRSLIQGDLGHSYFYQAPVMNVLWGSFRWTLLLTGTALLLSSAAGIFLGIESGYRHQSKADRSLLAGLMFLSSFPDFFVGMLLLLLFGVSLGILPLGGALTQHSNLTGFYLLFDILRHLFLPLFSLTLVRIASNYLLMRNCMTFAMQEPYILTAVAKGCKEMAVKYRHAARNAILPVFTSAGVQFTQLITGALFVEIVFSYPGMGYLLYNAVLNRDYPLLQGISLMLMFTVLLINLLVDCCYKRIDPRVSNEH